MNNAQSGMDLAYYYRLVMEKKLLFVSIACAVICVVIAVAFILPNKYMAKSKVFIEQNIINSLIEGIAVTSSIEERLSVLDHSIKSRRLLTKVLEEVGIDVTAMHKDKAESTIKYFQKNTRVDIERKSRSRGSVFNLFTVSYTDTDPEFARDYINVLVQRYIEENISDKKEEASVANQFLLEQIDHFKHKIDSYDKTIIEFRKEKGIYAVLDEKKIVEEIKSDEDEIGNIRLNKMELEAKRKMIKRQLSSEHPYTVAIRGYNDNTLSGRLAMQENRLKQLLAKYTENYPDVIKVKAEIESIKAQLKEGIEVTGDDESSESGMSTLNPLYQQLKEEMAKNELEMAALDAKEKHLTEKIETKKNTLKNIPEEKKVLADLERDRDSFKKTYDQLIQRLGQSEVSTQMEVQDKAATFRIVDPAILPVKPVSPNRLKIIVIGIIASLGIAFGSLMLLDKLDQSIKSVDNLRGFGYPILSVIPTIKTSEDVILEKKKDLIIYALAGLYCISIIGALVVQAMMGML
jgi:succinoglycan biosynthesis transport protein ExoP